MKFLGCLLLSFAAFAQQFVSTPVAEEGNYRVTVKLGSATAATW